MQVRGLRRLGVTAVAVFGIACFALILLQLTLLIHGPVQHVLLWGVLAIFGAITVLRYRIGANNGNLSVIKHVRCHLTYLLWRTRFPGT